MCCDGITRKNIFKYLLILEVMKVRIQITLFDVVYRITPIYIKTYVSILELPDMHEIYIHNIKDRLDGRKCLSLISTQYYTQYV